MKPWHDTPIHKTPDGSECGPAVPFYTCRPGSVPHGDDRRMRHIRCAACGEDWIEDSLVMVAQVWWSAGAYEGHMATEDT